MILHAIDNVRADVQRLLDAKTAADTVVVEQATTIAALRARIAELEARPQPGPIVRPQPIAQKLGLFVGNGAERPSRLRLTEDLLGVRASWLCGMTDRTLSRFAGSAGGWLRPTSPHVGRPGLLEDRGLILAVPLGWGVRSGKDLDAVRRNLRDVAAGRWDGDYARLADLIRQSRCQDLVVRIGWECNMAWPGWTMRAGDDLFGSAWRHVAAILRPAAPEAMRLRLAVCGGWREWSAGMWPTVAAEAEVWSLDWYLRPGRRDELPTMRSEVLRFLDVAQAARRSVIFGEVGVGADVHTGDAGAVQDVPAMADAIADAMAHPACEALCVFSPARQPYPLEGMPAMTARLRERLAR